MKVNLINFQHFDYKPAQWKPKPSFEETSVNHNFVFLRGIDISRNYLPLILSR
jgi:hypothetical protein